MTTTTTLPRATLADVLSWEPCYTKKQLRELAAGRETIDAIEALQLDVPDRDKLWLVMREEMIPAPILHEFACRCAETALLAERAAGREPDARSWEAIAAKRRWLAGECSAVDLSEAAARAWAARAAAARSAEAAAAWAAWAAARSAAAWAAAAAEEAAWAAARSAAAAEEAAWAEQVAILAGMLEEAR